MAKQKPKIYVVWQGKMPGIYTSWTECEAQVKGVEGARYKGFCTQEEAEAAYTLPAPTVVRKEKIQKLSSERRQGNDDIIYPSLAVDAACSGNPGVLEFRGVITDTGTEVFHRGPYKGGTNNIGEFLAIVLGLAYLKKHNLPWVLYSDSKTAQAWVRNKQCKTKLVWNPENAILLEMIRAAEKWLHENTWTTPIYKWQTEPWGEIPADFGRK